MDIRRLLNTISELMGEKRYDEAAAACRQIIMAAPHSAFAYLTLGDILRAQGNLNEAVEAYREAIKLKPKQVQAIRRKLDETIDALSRQKVVRGTSSTAVAALNVLAGSGAPPAPPPPAQSPATAPASSQVPLDPLPAWGAAIPLPPVAPLPAAETTTPLPPAALLLASETTTLLLPVDPLPTPETAAAPVVAFPGQPEQPSLAPDAGGYTLQSEFLTPRRMYQFIALAVVVVLLSVLMNCVPWRHHQRSTAKMTPIPLGLEREPLSSTSPLPTEMPNQVTPRK